MYPFLVFYHHVLQYTLLQVLEAFLISLALGPEHCANLWHASLEGVQDSWLFFSCDGSVSSPPTVPLCPSPSFIFGVLLGRGWVAHLCLLALFLNVGPRRFLMRIQLPFFLLGESSIIWGVYCSSLFLLDRGYNQGNSLEFLSTVYLFILFSYLLK